MIHSEALRDYVAFHEQGPGGGPALVAYWDSTGKVWTIGYGRTRGVQRGDTCTEEQADAWLDEELAEFAEGVEALRAVPLEQHQFDALVSLAYNIGLGALAESTLIRRVNGAEHDRATIEFLRYHRSGGRPRGGLVKRRGLEALVYGRAEYIRC